MKINKFCSLGSFIIDLYPTPLPNSDQLASTFASVDYNGGKSETDEEHYVVTAAEEQ